MNEPELQVELHRIYIEDRPGPYLVAKVGRISSPPLRTDADDDPRAVARLLDVFRCGTASRAYVDYLEFQRLQGQDPAPEWAAYVRAAAAVAKVQRVEPITLAPLSSIDGTARPIASVTYYRAEMKGRPYIVAGIGPVLGSPAAVLLHEYPAESALDRLADVFRIGRARGSLTEVAADPVEDAIDWARLERAVTWGLATSAI